MSTAAPVLFSDVSMLPTDLSRFQRNGLVAVVVLVHALLAFVAVTRVVSPSVVAEPPAIEVALISHEAPVVAPPVPTPVPVPVQPKPVPAVKQAPAVLASAKPALPTDMQAPAVVPVTESKPIAAAAPPVAPSAPPAPPVVEVARPPAQPVVLPSSALRYLVEPKLHYPRVSSELGESGVVKLQVLIDEQGRPNSNITVAQSSGFPRLDQEAVRAMRAARFQPRIVDGVARSVSTIASLTFNLEEQ